MRSAKFFLLSCCLLSSITSHAKTSGLFTAYNDTDSAVTITVGDFFPTEYVIPAHSYKWVHVTTNNQNIHIKKVQSVKGR